MDFGLGFKINTNSFKLTSLDHSYLLVKVISVNIYEASDLLGPKIMSYFVYGCEFDFTRVCIRDGFVQPQIWKNNEMIQKEHI